MRLIITSTIALFSSLIAAKGHSHRGSDVVPAPPRNNHKTCTVHPLGNHTDDTPQILKAFSDCNHGGTVVFPKNKVYWIATRLNPVIYDVTIDWQGIWTVCSGYLPLTRSVLTIGQLSDDLTYWRNNSYPVAFQNHAAGVVFTGDRIHINGRSTGGINGNGNAWYNAEKAVTQPGRPMPFVFWNVSEVFVEHCMSPFSSSALSLQDPLANKTFWKSSLDKGFSSLGNQHHERY